MLCLQRNALCRPMPTVQSCDTQRTMEDRKGAKGML